MLCNGAVKLLSSSAGKSVMHHGQQAGPLLTYQHLALRNLTIVYKTAMVGENPSEVWREMVGR
jgi:hypothetical protein